MKPSRQGDSLVLHNEKNLNDIVHSKIHNKNLWIFVVTTIKDIHGFRALIQLPISNKKIEDLSITSTLDHYEEALKIWKIFYSYPVTSNSILSLQFDLQVEFTSKIGNWHNVQEKIFMEFNEVDNLFIFFNHKSIKITKYLVSSSEKTLNSYLSKSLVLLYKYMEKLSPSFEKKDAIPKFLNFIHNYKKENSDLKFELEELYYYINKECFKMENPQFSKTFYRLIFLGSELKIFNSEFSKEFSTFINKAILSLFCYTIPEEFYEDYFNYMIEKIANLSVLYSGEYIKDFVSTLRSSCYNYIDKNYFKNDTKDELYKKLTYIKLIKQEFYCKYFYFGNYLSNLNYQFLFKDQENSKLLQFHCYGNFTEFLQTIQENYSISQMPKDQSHIEETLQFLDDKWNIYVKILKIKSVIEINKFCRTLYQINLNFAPYFFSSEIAFKITMKLLKWFISSEIDFRVLLWLANEIFKASKNNLFIITFMNIETESYKQRFITRCLYHWSHETKLEISPISVLEQLKNLPIPDFKNMIHLLVDICEKDMRLFEKLIDIFNPKIEDIKEKTNQNIFEKINNSKKASIIFLHMIHNLSKETQIREIHVRKIYDKIQLSSLETKYFLSSFLTEKISIFESHLNYDDFEENIFIKFNSKTILQIIELFTSDFYKEHTVVQFFVENIRKSLNKITEGTIYWNHYSSLLEANSANIHFKKLMETSIVSGLNLPIISNNHNKYLDNYEIMIKIFNTFCEGFSDLKEKTEYYHYSHPRFNMKPINEVWNDGYLIDFIKNYGILTVFFGDNNNEYLQSFTNQRKIDCFERLNFVKSKADEFKIKLTPILNNYANMTIQEVLDCLDTNSIEVAIDKLNAFNKLKNANLNHIINILLFTSKIEAYRSYYRIVDCLNKNFNLQIETPELSLYTTLSEIEGKKDIKLEDYLEIQRQCIAKIDASDETKKISSQLSILVNSEEQFKFLLTLEGHFELIKEKATDLGSSNITWKEIYDIEIVFLFYKTLIKSGPFNNLKQFYNEIEKICREQNIKFNGENSVFDKLKNFISNYEKIKNLSCYLENGSVSKIKIILDCMKYSKVVISWQNMEFIIRMNTDENKLIQEWNLNQLKELKNIVEREIHHLESINQQTKDDDKLQLLNNFREICHSISNLFFEVSNLYESGFFYEETQEESFKIQQGDSLELADILDKWINFNKKWNEELQKVYEENYLATFLLGKMFSESFKLLSDKKSENLSPFSIPNTKDWNTERVMTQEDLCDENYDPKRYQKRTSIYYGFSQEYMNIKEISFEKHINLFIYLGIKSEEKLNKIILDERILEDIPQNFEKRMNFLLQKVWKYSEHNFGIKNKNIVPTPGLNYLYNFSTNQNSNLYQIMLSMFASENVTLPKIHNFLFCYEDTKVHEIMAFIYRIFICPQKENFVLIFPEKLHNDVQLNLVQIYEDLRKRDRIANLFVIFSKIESEIVKFFLDLKNYKNYVVEGNKRNEEKTINYWEQIEKSLKDIFLVKSSNSLEGKSYVIRNLCRNSPDLDYNFLRISGKLIKSYFFEKLKNVSANKPLCLHFDIGFIASESLEIVNDFLFQIIFMRSYIVDEEVIIIHEDSRIYIECETFSFLNLEKILPAIFKISKIQVFQDNLDKDLTSPISFEFLHSLEKSALTKLRLEKIEDQCRKFDNFQEKTIAVQKGNGNINYNHLSFEKMKTLSETDNFLKICNRCFEEKNLNPSIIQKLDFERIVHYLAYSFLSAYILFFEGENYDTNILGKAIVDSALYLCQSAGKNLEMQQSKNKKLFSEEEAIQNPQISEDTVLAWEKMNCFLVLFANSTPIFVYKSSEAISEKIKRVKFLQRHLNEFQSPTHFSLFNCLSNFNNKLHSCKICPNCLTKSYSDCKNAQICDSNIYTIESLLHEAILLLKRIKKLPENFIKILDRGCSIINNFNDFKLILNKKIINRENFPKIVNRLLVFVDFVEENMNKDYFEDILLSKNDLFCINCKEITKFSNSCKNCSDKIYSAEDYEDYPNSEFLLFGENKAMNDLNFIEFFGLLIKKKFVLTSDNYVKLLMIYTKVKSRLPVVLMGETGCGKTSLIRFLCEVVLDEYFQIFNIHAGVTEENFEEIVSKFIEECIKNPKNDHWILFDEFNTSDIAGLIKTLMIDRRFINRLVPPNAVFIATCNPFKFKIQSDDSNELIGLKKIRRINNKLNLLQYLVNPVPESLLYYTLNFGHLSESDERTYIQTILNQFLDPKMSQCFSDAIKMAHSYIQKNLNESATSLRDIRRFEFIYKFLKDQYFVFIDRLPNIEKNSAIISFIMCYYLRFTSKIHRKEIIKIVARCLNEPEIGILDLFVTESSNLLKQLELEPWVAQNEALTENLFTMFICLFNKIPIAIIGKPGSSKSLALQIIFSQFLGKQSKNNFLKSFPGLRSFSYQGSEYSTSASIEHVFNMVEEAQKEISNEQQQDIAVFVFDEIGLSELASTNPLKTLHARLEQENLNVAFVGISNWSLDASKMNRLLCLSRAEPDEKEVLRTAQLISSSIINNQEDYEFIHNKIESLAKMYITFKASIAQIEGSDLYGLRDLYCLIKQISNGYKRDHHFEMSRNKLQNIFDNVVRKAISRNFNFNNSQVTDMWESYARKSRMTPEEMQKFEEPLKKDLIIESLNDFDSRFMMIVAENLQEQYHICSLFSDERVKIPSRTYETIIGSPLSEDLNSEDYLVETVGDIILKMEKPNVLLLAGLDSVYSSLYDLFNQNYTKVKDKSYCRIVQGNMSKGLYEIHPQFKIVVFLTHQDLKNADEPLVNRFEKYTVSHRDLIERGITEKKEIALKIIQSIIGDKHENSDEIKDFIFNYSDICLESLIKYTENEEENMEEFFGLFLAQFFKICNLNILKTIAQNKNIANRESIVDKLFEVKKITIVDIITNPENKIIPLRTLVFTFSPITRSVIHHIKKIYENYEETIEELYLSQYKSQKDFTQRFKGLMLKRSPKFILVHVLGIYQNRHMPWLLNLINSLLNDSSIHCLVVVHFRPESIKDCDKFFINSKWKEIFIDNLFETVSDFLKPITDPINSVRDIIMSYLPHIKNKMNKILSNLEEKSEFNELMRENGQQLASRLKILKENINFAPELILELIEEAIKQDKDLERKISLEQRETFFQWVDRKLGIIGLSLRMIEAVKKALKEYYLNKIINVVLNFEHHSVFPYLVKALNNNEKNKLLLLQNLSKKVLKPSKINGKIPRVEHALELICPFSLYEFNKLNEKGIFGNQIEKNEHEKMNNLLSFKNNSIYLEYFEEYTDLISSLTTDLIYLYLCKKLQYNIPSEIIHQILHYILQDKFDSFLKEYLSHTESFINFFLIFYEFYNIFGKRWENVFSTIRENIQTNEEKHFILINHMKEFIDQLIVECLKKENIKDLHRIIVDKYQSVDILIKNASDYSECDFKNVEALYALGGLFKAIDKTVESSNIFERIYEILPNQFSEIFDNLQIFSNFIETIYDARQNLNESENGKRSLMLFQVSLCFLLLNEKLNESEEDQIEIYSYIFEQIEKDAALYMHLNKVINAFVTDSNLENFWKKDINLNAAPEQENLFFEWLQENIIRFPNRLPHILINDLFSRSDTEELFSQETSLNLRVCEDIFDKLCNIGPKNSLSLSNVFEIITMKLLVDYNIKILINNSENANLNFINKMNEFLRKDDLFAKSLQIYFMKVLKKACDDQQIDFKFHLTKINEGWATSLLNHENQTNFNICAPKDSFESYNFFIHIFSHLSNSPADQTLFSQIINYLKEHLVQSIFTSIYTAAINIFILNRYNDSKFGKYLGNKKTELTKLIGHVGFVFLEKMMNNFDDKDPFAWTQNLKKEEQIKNASILFSTVAFINRKYSNDFLANYLYPQIQMPLNNNLEEMNWLGCIQKPDEAIIWILSIMEIKPTSVFKCSNECNYFISFGNCGMVNVQEDKNGNIIPIECPLCKKVIGTKGNQKHGVPMERLIWGSYSHMLPLMIREIDLFKDKYPQGYKNPKFTILESNKFELNVLTQTTNILNFMSNSLLLLLKTLGILPENEVISSLLLRTDSIEKNFDFFKKNFRTSEWGILLNSIISEICRYSPSDPKDPKILEHYFSFEKKLQSNILLPIYENFEASKNKYKQIISECTKNLNSQAVLLSLVEEVKVPHDNEYPLLKHLRISPRKLNFEEFVKIFLNQPALVKIQYPITNYIIENKDNLDQIKVLLDFKEFYEKFLSKERSIFRHEAQSKSIKKFLDENPDLQKHRTTFITSWNKYFKANGEVSFECSKIPTRHLNLDQPVSTVIPNTYRSNEGIDLVHILLSTVQTQNEFVENLNKNISAGNLLNFGWKQIKKDTVFSLTEEKLENILNEHCRIVYCDYGDYGNMKIDFLSLENELRLKFASQKKFIKNPNLIPQFNYKFESSEMGRLVAQLRESFDQQKIDGNEKKFLKTTLVNIGHNAEDNVFSQIYNFILSKLLPDLLLHKQNIYDTPIHEIIKNSSIKDQKIRDLFSGTLKTLRLNQLYSFILLLEILIFENYFISRIDTVQTRLETNPNSPEWNEIQSIHLKNLGKNSEFASNKNIIMEAIARLILRTSFNDANLDTQIYFNIENETLWEVDTNFEPFVELFGNITIDLRQVWLFYRSMFRTNLQQENLENSTSTGFGRRENQDVLPAATKNKRKKIR